MKFLIIILSVILFTSCDCGCDIQKYGKHKYKIGDVVHLKVSDSKVIILDTVRKEECKLSYDIKDRYGNTGLIFEIELK
jgi:hypothetical protein